MTPEAGTAHRLTLAWGVHAVVSADVGSVTEMTNFACWAAAEEGFARKGQTVVITAGLPFGEAGTTNLLRVVQIGHDN